MNFIFQRGVASEFLQYWSAVPIPLWYSSFLTRHVPYEFYLIHNQYPSEHATALLCVLCCKLQSQINKLPSNQIEWINCDIVDFKGRIWLRNCVTTRKVAGSNPGGAIEIFHWQSVVPPCEPGVDSVCNRNEYQEYFLGLKAAGT